MKCLVPPEPEHGEDDDEDDEHELKQQESVDDALERPSIADLESSSLKTLKSQADKRPAILWNMVLILLSAEPGRYDSRGRVFLRRLSVDQFQYGSWLDFIEDFETPLTNIKLQFGSKEQPLDGTEEGASFAAKKSLQHSVSAIRSTSATASYTTVGPTLENLAADRTTMLLKNNEKQIREKKDRKKRAALMAAAAVGGGVIIGVSAGLAAPMLGTLVSYRLMLFISQGLVSGQSLPQSRLAVLVPS